jgi:hypothetical protein
MTSVGPTIGGRQILSQNSAAIHDGSKTRRYYGNLYSGLHEKRSRRAASGFGDGAGGIAGFGWHSEGKRISQRRQASLIFVICFVR